MGKPSITEKPRAGSRPKMVDVTKLEQIVATNVGTTKSG